MKKHKTTFQRLSWIAEPRYHNALWGLSYFALLVTGIITLIDTSNILLGAIYEPLAYIWPAALILAGLIGTPAAILGVWSIEKAGLIAYFTAAGMLFVGIIFGGPLVAEGRTLALGLLISTTLHYMKRYDAIKNQDLDPTRLITKQLEKNIQN